MAYNDTALGKQRPAILGMAEARKKNVDIYGNRPGLAQTGQDLLASIGLNGDNTPPVSSIPPTIAAPTKAPSYPPTPPSVGINDITGNPTTQQSPVKPPLSATPSVPKPAYQFGDTPGNNQGYLSIGDKQYTLDNGKITKTVGGESQPFVNKLNIVPAVPVPQGQAQTQAPTAQRSAHFIGAGSSQDDFVKNLIAQSQVSGNPGDRFRRESATRALEGMFGQQNQANINDKTLAARQSEAEASARGAQSKAQLEAQTQIDVAGIQGINSERTAQVTGQNSLAAAQARQATAKERLLGGILGLSSKSNPTPNELQQLEASKKLYNDVFKPQDPNAGLTEAIANLANKK